MKATKLSEAGLFNIGNAHSFTEDLVSKINVLLAVYIEARHNC